MQCEFIDSERAINNDQMVKEDLINWLVNNSTKLDAITLIGVLIILTFYNTDLVNTVQGVLAGQFPTINNCLINFYIFHSFISVFMLVNIVSSIFQTKKLKKNNIKELCNYLNQPSRVKDLFTGNMIFRRKRKFTVFFVLSILALLVPLILYDWYKFIEQCNPQMTSIPFGWIGMVCYSALCIRIPIYLIGILNFKFGDLL